MKIKHLVSVITLCLFCVPIAHSFETGTLENHQPFTIRNNSPVVSIYGISTFKGPTVTDKGKRNVRVTLDHTSHFNVTEKDQEQIIFDGETTRLTASLMYGFAEAWEVGVELPYVWHGGGFLDDFIVDWHDVFGFSQNGRDVFPRGQITYRYNRNSSTLFNVQSSQQGIGDVSVFLSKQIGQHVLRTFLEIPTGSSNKLLGSGSWDFGFSLEGTHQWTNKLHSNYLLGMSFLSSGEVLPDQQKHWVGSIGMDLSYQATERVRFALQWNGHSAVYGNTNLNELGDWSGILTMGGTLKLTDNIYLDLAVTENVPNADVVSDVGFYISLRANQ